MEETILGMKRANWNKLFKGLPAARLPLLFFQLPGAVKKCE